MAPNANRLIAVLVTAIIASGLSTRAQTASQTGADSLRGVRSIVLFVSADKTLMDAGVDVSAIKTDVEVELRLVGLKIVESSNATTAQIVDRNSICLEVDLNGTVNPDKQSISYLTTIKVIQQVRLLRNPSRLTTGTTWEFGQFGYAGLGTLSKSGEIVDKGIKSFLNDYLTANPKPSRVTLPPSAK